MRLLGERTKLKLSFAQVNRNDRFFRPTTATRVPNKAKGCVWVDNIELECQLESWKALCLC